MPNVATITPLNQFFDTNGSPLNSGFLFFGLPDQDPEQFPVSMFWDAAGTVSALQPIRTISGYPSRAGSPAIIYGPDSYSLRVRNSASVQVLYAPVLGGLATSAALAASDGSSLVGFIQSGTGAVARTALAKMREIISVFDFMTTAQIADVQAGTALLDVTTAIQTAITAAAGKSLYFPTGTYKVSTLTLTSNNTTLHGDSRATRIITSSATGQVLDIGDGTNEARNIVLRDLTFWSSVTRTAGNVIRARKLARSEIHNVYIGTAEDNNVDGNRLFDGITIAEFDSVTISGCYVLTSNSGIIVYGNSGQTFGAEIYINGGTRILRQSEYGIHIAGGAGGVKLDDLDVSLCEYGLFVSDNLGGAFNREMFVGSKASFDACTTGNGRGIWFDANSCVYTELDGTWVASNIVGIEIQPAQPAGAAWKMSDVRVYNNSSDGIVINDGFITLDGVSVNGNGTAGGSGIVIGTAITDGFILSSSQIRNNGSGTGYGITIVIGTNNILIEGNNFIGNAQGPISNLAGISLTNIVRDNLGLITEANGSATVLAAGSTVVVNHGLHDTPTHVFVERTGPSDGTPHYVSTITSTQFTINNGAAAGVNRDFAWRAIRGFR